MRSVHGVGSSRDWVMGEEIRDNLQMFDRNSKYEGVARGGGYAWAAALLDMSLNPRAEVPIRLQLSIASPFVACLEAGCHCRVSIGGRSRASALATAWSSRPRLSFKGSAQLVMLVS